MATIKHRSFEGRKLLLVQKLDLNGATTGYYDVAVDDVQAGVGDTVLVMDEGGSARAVLGDPDAPIRAVVVAFVDDMERTSL